MNFMSTNKWYKTLRRWGQTNLTEIDPEICDIGWWKEFWKKTDTQGPAKITFKLDDFTPVSVAATENDGKAALTSEGNSDVITLDKIGMQQLIIVSGRLEGNYV